MVTFRNNNNNRRNNFRRGERNFKPNGERSKFVTNFQIMKIFKEKFLENNYNASKLIEKYNNLAEKLYQSEIKYYQKIIFNMLIILCEF